MSEAAVTPWITVGHVAGAYGVQGWLRLLSYTAEPASLLLYQPWRWRRGNQVWMPETCEARDHGRGFVVRIAGCTDREQAAAYGGSLIEIPATALPPLAAGEYYWQQLMGLTVETEDGQPLGVVDHLLATGANDVLVVAGERERLIPYVRTVVRQVDVDRRRLVVAWDPEF